MTDYDIHEELERLKETAFKRMNHPYLSKTIQPPVLDNEKILMLYRMLRESHCSAETLETYVVTIMLVQAALDTHDLVDIHNHREHGDKTTDQLTVLAGDYYSGLYYFLLAEIEDFELIGDIARSIQRINEHKMHLYKKKNETVEETFASLRVVESALLQCMAHYFEMPLWGTFFEEYFLLRRLLAERHHFLQSKPSPVIDALVDTRRRKFPFSSQQEKIQQFLQLLDGYIDLARQSVERLFSNHARFEKMIGQRIWNIFMEHGYRKQELAEEG